MTKDNGEQRAEEGILSLEQLIKLMSEHEYNVHV